MQTELGTQQESLVSSLSSLQRLLAPLIISALSIELIAADGAELWQKIALGSIGALGWLLTFERGRILKKSEASKSFLCLSNPIQIKL